MEIDHGHHYILEFGAYMQAQEEHDNTMVTQNIW